MRMREENAVFTPVKLSLKEDEREGRFLFPMQSFCVPSRSRPIYFAKMLVSVRRLVGSTQALVSMSSHRLLLASRGRSVGAVAILDCIHDTVGEDSHLARYGLDSLFELCDVRAGGEHTVKARRPPFMVAAVPEQVS